MINNDSTLKPSIDVLAEALKIDDDLYLAFRENISCAIMDECPEVPKIKRDLAARRFLDWLISGRTHLHILGKSEQEMRDRWVKSSD